MFWVGGLCVLALVAWIGFRWYTGIVVEDAYITYRYARNVALGNGFVYNLGEHVLGTTTPLYTLMLAAFGAVLGVEHIPLISSLLMPLAGVAAIWITVLAMRKLGLPRWLPIIFVGALAFNRDILWTMTGGLETPLVILLMAASLYALANERVMWAATWAALLVLARIDGAIWSVGIFVLIYFQHRSHFFKAMGVGALIVLPWVIFAFWYFGSPIPNTVSAKSTIGVFEDYPSGLNALSYLGWGLLYLSRLSPFGRLIGLIFFFFGGWKIFTAYRAPVLKLLFVFPFVFLLAYFVGHAPKFPWYLIPLTWAGLIVGVVGMWEIGRSIYESLPDRMRQPRAVRWALVIFFLVYGAALVNRGLTTTQFHHDWMLEENFARKPLGLWLKDHSAADATVAMEAIGYQGYFSERRVIDFAGLISPEVVDLYRRTGSNAQVLYSIMTTDEPDYIVLREFEVTFNQCFLGGPLFEDGDQQIYFKDNYREAAHFRPTAPGTGRGLFNLVVYQRITNEAPDSP